MSQNSDELYKELQQATKRANQRLVRLEQKGELTPAYKIAENDIRNILENKTGKPRFKANKNMSYNQMQQQLKYVNKFNNSKSSTVTGMKDIIKKRDATITKRYGTEKKKLTPLYRILSSDTYKKMTELLPSSMVVQSVSEALNRGASEKGIVGALKRTLKNENDDFLIDYMTEALDTLKTKGS